MFLMRSIIIIFTLKKGINALAIGRGYHIVKLPAVFQLAIDLSDVSCRGRSAAGNCTQNFIFDKIS